MRLDHQSVSKHQNESFDMFRNVNLIALPQGDILLEELVEIIWRAFLYFRSMKTPLINGNLAEQVINYL